MFFECELAGNFTLRMSKLGLAQMESTDKTESQWGGFTVTNLLTAKVLVLLGFSITHQWLHLSWILAKSLLGEAAIADLCAGLRCEQLPVWSYLHSHIHCSPPAQTFRLCRGLTKEEWTHFPVARQARNDNDRYSTLFASTINHDSLLRLERKSTNGQHTATDTGEF